MRLVDADALKKSILNSLGIDSEAYLMFGSEKKIWKLINDAPTIEPERKVGTWEQVEEIPSIRKRFKRYCCSGCKKAGFDTWNYCPECGQRNRGGEQDADT